MWWTTPQHHSATHHCNLTQDVYPMLVLLSSRNRDPEDFVPILSSGELACKGQQHRRYSHGVSFQFSLHLWVLWNEGFYGGWSANPATNLQIKSNPVAGGCLHIVGHLIWMAIGSQGAPSSSSMGRTIMSTPVLLQGSTEPTPHPIPMPTTFHEHGPTIHVGRLVTQTLGPPHAVVKRWFCGVFSLCGSKKNPYALASCECQ